jgi:hypothetical protein
MGPYSGGCNCVDPHGGSGTPTRTDPNDPGYIPPPPVPAPTFGVELLNWNDGGLSDPPAASVTVSGVHPGHDCLLVVLIDAIGSLANTSGLAPAITGGGLDWHRRRDVDRTAGTASTILAVAPVGRTDPGTFSVVVTWAAPMTSRSHIVTVWRVTGAADDYLERFDAGSVPYALATSTPPEHIQPGNGIVAVDMASDRHDTGVYAPTRLVDITIAQSLAEEGTAPFGAILSTSNGTWVYPPNAPAQPTTTLLDVTWSDDFERADGPLGSDWVLGPAPGYDDIHPFAISSGAAVATATDTAGVAPSTVNMMHYATAQAADAQVIEVELDDCWPNGYVQLYTNIAGSGLQAQFADFQFNESGGPNIVVSVYHFESDGSSSSSVASATVSHAGTTPVLVRLESAPDGTQNVFIDGALAATGIDPAPVSGSYVGMGLQPTTAFVDNSKILRAGGSLLARVRKTSWVAGWRVGYVSDQVILSDVNTGPSNIQSAQAALVVESPEPEQTWRILDYALRADTSGATTAATFTLNNAPRPGALVVVFVGLTASTDVIDSVAVTGAAFTRSAVAHQTGSSWGQGGVYTAVASLDMDPSSWAITVGYPACESVSAVAYEVTVQSDTAPVGGTAAATTGAHTAGSVNGSSTISLSATDAAATTLAYLHVAAAASNTSGASASGWTEELEVSRDTQAAYFQTMSRASGSTSTAVTWTDLQTGTAAATSAVQLAIQVVPYDGLPTTGAGSGVYLGGVTDPFNGTISSAGAFDPVTGFPMWSFP